VSVSDTRTRLRDDDRIWGESRLDVEDVPRLGRHGMLGRR